MNRELPIEEHVFLLFIIIYYVGEFYGGDGVFRLVLTYIIDDLISYEGMLFRI